MLRSGRAGSTSLGIVLCRDACPGQGRVALWSWGDSAPNKKTLRRVATQRRAPLLYSYSVTNHGAGNLDGHPLGRAGPKFRQTPSRRHCSATDHGVVPQYRKPVQSLFGTKSASHARHKANSNGTVIRENPQDFVNPVQRRVSAYRCRNKVSHLTACLSTINTHWIRHQITSRHLSSDKSHARAMTMHTRKMYGMSRVRDMVNSRTTLPRKDRCSHCPDKKNQRQRCRFGRSAAGATRVRTPLRPRPGGRSEKDVA